MPRLRLRVLAPCRMVPLMWTLLAARSAALICRSRTVTLGRRDVVDPAMPGWQGNALRLGRVATDTAVIAQCALTCTMRQVSNLNACPGDGRKAASTFPVRGIGFLHL